MNKIFNTKIIFNSALGNLLFINKTIVYDDIWVLLYIIFNKLNLSNLSAHRSTCLN